MQKNSTKHEDKWWYRFCKVLYWIVSWIITLLTLGYFFFVDYDSPFDYSQYSDFWGWFLRLWVVFLLYWAVFKWIKVLFFYIVFGEKIAYMKELLIPLKRIREIFFEKTN